MDRENQSSEWERQFIDFLNALEIAPPADVAEGVSRAIASRLNPSPLAVFAKLVAVVLFAGSASLLICPQLGFGSDIGVMRSFMSLGPLGCRAACGGFFMLCSIIAACLALQSEELRVLRKTKFLSISAMAGLALGAFLCASPDVLMTAALTWFIGASVGGILSLEVGYRAKMWFLTQRGAQAA